jgi:putative Mg2+ transporter-C (MgtC) family protein
MAVMAMDSATLDYLLRILVASGCGMLIGLERDNHLKQAGIRTHMIVALGAALMTIVSKYGFFDLMRYDDFMRVDPARVAASVAGGIGFLGAGMIFMHNRVVSGLTTAAGIWTTAGIGMAIGAGMYPIGGAATALVLAIQLILHRGKNRFSIKGISKANLTDLAIEAQETPQTVTDILKRLSEADAVVMNLDMERGNDDMIRLDLLLRFPKGIDVIKLVSSLHDIKEITSVEF